jgi:hypothetical protein
MTTAAGSTVFHKSVIAYIYTALATIVLAGFLGLVEAELTGGGRTFVTLIILAVLVRGVYRLAWLRSVTWTVTADGLQVRRGILPWRKLSWYNPWATLFEAWYKHGFFGYLLRYGTCGVTRGEGVTTQMSDTRMGNAKRLTGLINSGVQGYRQRMTPMMTTAPPAAAPVVASPADPVTGLSELSRLLSNGDITREEFDRLKSRLIGS